MPKPWRLSRQAEASLLDIAVWTIDTFGPRQAQAYEEDLIANCSGIASGGVPSESCPAIIDPDLKEDLRFVRSGQHFIVFVEDEASVIIVDVLHSRCNLPAKLAILEKQQPEQNH
jgi:toxin ParE1/3/4